MNQMLQLLLFWLTLVIWPGLCFAQEQLISVEYFGEDKGLNTTVINDLFQDREGFLWLATREGLIRYDGNTFKYFRNQPGDSTSIYNNHVLCLTEDPEGNIWAGLARGGVSCYDRKSGRFRNYPFTEKLKIKTTPVVRIFFDREEEIWLGLSGYGIVQLNRQTGAFQTFDLVTAESAPHLSPEELPYFNTALNFWQDENGLLWCATSDDLYTFNKQTGQATPHRFEKIAATGFWQNQAYALLPEGDCLWVGGWGSGLRRFNRKTGEWKQYLMIDNPPVPDAVNVINKIAPKSGDELWVTSNDLGLGIFNKKTEQFLFLHQDPENYPGIPADGVDNIYLDRQGNIWMDYAGQLTRLQLKDRNFNFNPVKSILLQSNEYSVISSMQEDRENRFRFIGFYDGDGIQILDKSTGQISVPEFKIQPGQGESDRQVRGILQSHDGTIWVLGRHLLYRFNPLTVSLEVPIQPPVFAPELGSNYYTQIAEDATGDLWMGTSLFGIFRYSTDTGASTHFMPDTNMVGAIPTNVIGVVASDSKGRIWFGSRDKTAYGYYQSDEERFIYLDPNGKPTTEVTSMRMNSFFNDLKGDIWACSEQGVLHFDCSSDQPRLVKKYTVSDGLPSDYVIEGVEDQHRYLWLAVANNLVRLEPKSGQMISFGKQDGVPGLHNGIGIFNDGMLYFKTQTGYFTFNPDSLSPVRNQAPLILSSFKVNDLEQYKGSELNLSEPLIIPPDGRYFTLEFAALDLSHPELCKYEYMLEGLDTKWVKAGNRHFVNYTNVPAGQYLFRVKQEGMPDSEALVVPLEVQVAFYRRAWFWLLVGAIFIGVALIYYRNRQGQKLQLTELKSKAQLLEKEKALVQYESLKQQLNPHFLFNSLTSLSSLISIDPKAAAGFLENLSKTYRYILKSSEREVVPLQEELKIGASFVQLQKTRFGEGLQVHFNVGEEDVHLKIVPVTLQNLIENAIKHNIIDLDDPLVLDIFVEDRYLVVRNNLQKKKFVETSNKRGLANLKSFYRYLSDRPILVTEREGFYTIRIPLI